MEEILFSIVSSPMKISSKSKMLCENEFVMLLDCKKANFQYCLLYENLYNDCVKLKKEKENIKNEKINSKKN